jgi:hypothetical protein
VTAWEPPVRENVARVLAAAAADGPWNRESIAVRLSIDLAARPAWLSDLAGELCTTYRRTPCDRPRELAGVIDRWLASRNAEGELGDPPRSLRSRAFPIGMAESGWAVPELPTTGDLAAFLDLHAGELDWLADRQCRERTVHTPRLRNYRYRWHARRGGPPRAIEQPKRMLKECQRRVLHQILDAVPPHDAAHGFRRGHSAVTHARRHTGQEVVLRVDLEDFFASVTAGRVYGIFRRAGYPESVAHALTSLCTNVVPQDEWLRVPRPQHPRALAAHHRLGRRLATPHLPQGAPTSPALANLCGYRLDCRLAALADRVGSVYSRYADDLVLSGGRWLVRHSEGIRWTMSEIAREEGFRVNERKSQLMVGAGRQRVCGIVVNERPNLGRRERDRLRAAIHDALLHGPDAANRSGVPDLRAHLEGRVAWAEALNPRHGAALREQLARVSWATGST